MLEKSCQKCSWPGATQSSLTIDLTSGLEGGVKEQSAEVMLCDYGMKFRNCSNNMTYSEDVGWRRSRKPVT